KFTPRGGRVGVQVRGDAEGGATITVTDTGVGIDPAELPRIFDRFFRGSGASEARGSGSGLGLAIVRSIVEMHGGSVTVESRLGAGTTLRLIIPANARHPASSDSQRVVETTPPPAKHLTQEPAS